MNPIGRWVAHARENRCFALMVSLFATLAIAPWLDNVGARALIAALTTGSFASAVHAVGGGRGYALVTLALGTATLALGTIVQLTGSPEWAVPALSLFIVSGGFTLIRMLSYVVRPGAVIVDKIYAAVSVYLLAGFSWGGIYALTELLRPESFEWTHTGLEQPKTLLQSFVYLSFSTLASLGYGDITPVTPPARSLALLEVLFGTFYLVVIIARLVSAFGIDAPESRREPS
jgi:Ion channel